MIPFIRYVSLILLIFTKFTLCYQSLTSDQLRSLLSRHNISSLESHFPHFNRTRVPGSEGSLYVREYITRHFESLNYADGSTANDVSPWIIEHDTFEQKAYNFSNIVVSKKSRYGGDKYLVLAAHYDSLISPEGFIGAIDSAVSCSILMEAAKDLNGQLNVLFLQDEEFEMGLKLIFFDGEEAFESWSATDSIYGAKHLHRKYRRENKLTNIDLFVLLDLLGADENHIPSYFPQTHDNYNDLSSLESRLSQLKPELFSLTDKYLDQVEDEFSVKFKGYMEDDHIPFLRSGVPILHLIPSKFPQHWHNMGDNFDNIDIHAIERWSILIQGFVSEYMGGL
ncbi:hypothetical protein WICPIJ_001971 [Wickerhamomyces pijperi]|uniref:Peptide hydrolase n=1 Tax=Wickerhamomyces pijperi TaxID=599730 RepID=A0A9P8QCJ4_WICPI|nr:hypothetical protein WICPIJ_001971 [Wickerhamomyces pijperi]